MVLVKLGGYMWKNEALSLSMHKIRDINIRSDNLNLSKKDVGRGFNLWPRKGFSEKKHGGTSIDIKD